MRGFTLLEMLVVLVILGLVASIVAPPLARTVDRVRESGERDEVKRILGRLPLLARKAGTALDVPAGEVLPSTLAVFPEGWMVVAISGLSVSASGFCRRAEVEARSPNQRFRWRLNSPDCAVEDADAL